MLMAFFALACFQNVQLIYFSQMCMSLKPVHVFSVLFLPLLLFQKQLRVNQFVLGYVGLTALVSAANASQFGLNGLMLNYMFGLYVVVILTNCGKTLSTEEWADMICRVASVLMVLVWIKGVTRYQDFIWYFENLDKGHPMVWTFIGGGVNLESTWLGIFAFFFYKKGGWKWLYAGANLAVSFLYGSRCGMIVAGMAILWLLIPELPRLKERKVRWVVLAGLALVLIVLWATGLFEPLIGRSLRRFLSRGTDPGDIGRIKMWQYALQTILHYPLGCGAGNCIAAIVRVSGVPSGESNLHNVYLQAFIDFGWLGGALYLILLIRMFWNGRKELLSNPFLAALAAYCVVSMFQFRGGETIASFILALYLVTRKPESAGKNDPDLVVRNPFLRKKGEV